MEHTMVIELKPPLTCVIVRERSRCVCVMLRVWQLFLRSSGKKREGYMQYHGIFNARILFFKFWIEVRLLDGPQNYVPAVCVCVREKSHYKRVTLHVISREQHLPYVAILSEDIWVVPQDCPLWEWFWSRLRYGWSLCVIVCHVSEIESPLWQFVVTTLTRISALRKYCLGSELRLG